MFFEGELDHVTLGCRFLGHRSDRCLLRLRICCELLIRWHAHGDGRGCRGMGEDALGPLSHSRRALFPGTRVQKAVFLGVTRDCLSPEVHLVFFRVLKEECDVKQFWETVDVLTRPLAMGPRALPTMQSQSLRHVCLLHGRLS